MSNALFVTKSLLRKANLLKNSSKVFLRHMKLEKMYKKNPSAAMITDRAKVVGEDFGNPFHTTVVMNDELQVPFKVGVHRAVGGEHDFPNPGDMLCATLAACLESTLRMIAHRYNITLTKTSVAVSAVVDVRGTLRLKSTSPVEFQSMHVDLQVEADGLSERIVSTLVNGAKRSCIIYQTLRKGTPITISTKIED